MENAGECAVRTRMHVAVIPGRRDEPGISRFFEAPE